MTQQTIQALPGGDNTPVERILLQFPGVSQDSAASGLLHVRNDHANLQFRINGVQLPDGPTGFGSILDASWIGTNGGLSRWPATEFPSMCPWPTPTTHAI